jgi:hypothetical protein
MAVQRRASSIVLNTCTSPCDHTPRDTRVSAVILPMEFSVFTTSCFVPLGLLWCTRAQEIHTKQSLDVGPTRLGRHNPFDIVLSTGKSYLDTVLN